MSESTQWIDRVIAPLGPCGLDAPVSPYNRICAAVARGTERQGRELVAAILDLIPLAPDIETEGR